MNPQAVRVFVFFSVLSADISLVRASVVVDRQPFNTGGGSADTLFVNPFNGQPVWERSASGFTLATATSINRIRWWGFYDAQNPPATEVMRIRFYDSRPSDGLPGTPVFEQEFTNPLRIDTGRRVLLGILPHEYRYRVDLAQPLTLPANTRYWLEVTAIGELNSWFRWEYSMNDPVGYVHINENVGDWRLDLPGLGTAYQLVDVPEPATLGLLLTAFVMLPCRRLSRHRRTKANY